MKISVVVPSYNEEKYIEECLKAIKNQSMECELIVVDGGSKDKTVDIAKKYADKLVFDKKEGFAAAKNLGASSASGSIVAFTDSDTLVSEGWLERIACNLKGDCVGCGGPMLIYDGNAFDKFMWFVFAYLSPMLTSWVRFYQFPSPNCAYTKKAFDASGGFGRGMKMLDDTEFSNRMKKQGKLKFDRKMQVHTSARRTVQKGYLWIFRKYASAYLKYFSGKREMDIKFDRLN